MRTRREPNWITSSTMDVTNPVKASIPPASADSASAALLASIDVASSTGSVSSHRIRTTASPRASRTYSVGISQKLSRAVRSDRRERNALTRARAP